MAGRLTVSTLNNDTGVLATQNGMTGIAKAWLNYDCSTSTIRGSYNISSVTVVGTGNFTLNFSTAMPNANYAIAGLSRSPGVASGYPLQPETWTTTSTNILVLNSSATNYNPVYFNVVINGA